MRIADQVIEEVDEQMTVHSLRAPDKRPTAQSIFESYDEKPSRSAPIDVPGSHHKNDDSTYDRAHSVMQAEHQPYMFPNSELFSTSAPEEKTSPLQTPIINIEHEEDLELQKANPGKYNSEFTTNAQTKFIFIYYSRECLRDTEFSKYTDKR